MYTPIESSQVLQTSQVLVPSTSYVLMPAVSLPTEVTQVVTPVPQVSQIAVSQVVPTVSVAPQVSQLAVSQVVPSVSVVQPAPQLVPVPPPIPKPLTPSPPYEAFIPRTPLTRSVSDNISPQIYQFYKPVPVPPPATTTSFVNVPVATTVNVPVTTSVNIPVTTSYSTLTAPVPVVPTTNLLLGEPVYQTTTSSSFI
jgi:hypothetical protein